ncbi:BgTH12-05027 [Blumeria graminis f. sp. triticale]|uniref:BgTH12-05025 n=1 Tax=Blumeria graminis f. sp. triticale TaxID=1689686 RepID=A0A9W4GF56_BLUGR|nr:BgTH12-05025 [Blumeria graminis f. sp. triticale]CAD6502435.1 BgTH12-05027 [Blumeria graminis f. sp. triticale]
MHIYCSPSSFGRGSTQVKTIHGSDWGGNTISPWNISASRKGSDTIQPICNSIECTGVSRVSPKETSMVAHGSAIQGRSTRVLSCDYRGSDATGKRRIYVSRRSSNGCL